MASSSNSPSFEHLVEALLNPDFYPHPVEVITTIETHISIVFLTGRYAYKLKKPVNFGFLDFSTLQKRHQYYQLEFELNRRTAPQLYLDILPVYQQTKSYTLNRPHSTQTPVEYLLKMQQFDPNQVLGRYLQHHSLTATQTQQIAQQIAQLHQQAEKAPLESPWGTPEAILQPMLDNFPPLLKAFSNPEIQYKLRQLQAWTDFQAQQLHDVLNARKTSGYVCACHGDLHLDNITLINERPVLFDGIEFNEAFRWIDRMSDLAFLLIDLQDRKQPLLANQILNQYLQQTGDYLGLQLLPFYQVYRNLVRAKITALRAQQLTQQIEIQQTLKRAHHFILQAETIAYQLRQPQLILMQGISGSGKSYVAEKIAPTVQGIVISSDIERKRLFGLSPLQRPTESERPTLYGPEMNRNTYERLHQLAQTLLQLQYTVIIDATNLKKVHRQVFYALAQQQHAQVRIISVQKALTETAEQIKQRQQSNNNPSDATVEVMQMQNQWIEAVDQAELNAFHFPKETLYTLNQTDDAAIEDLKKWLNTPID
ncbi:bifunctional aminoglycoside phosphotransferase/ATP-binding protein [Galenea microaerophila]